MGESMELPRTSTPMYPKSLHPLSPMMHSSLLFLCASVLGRRRGPVLPRRLRCDVRRDHRAAGPRARRWLLRRSAGLVRSRRGLRRLPLLRRRARRRPAGLHGPRWPAHNGQCSRGRGLYGPTSTTRSLCRSKCPCWPSRRVRPSCSTRATSPRPTACSPPSPGPWSSRSLFLHGRNHHLDRHVICANQYAP